MSDQAGQNACHDATGELGASCEQSVVFHVVFREEWQGVLLQLRVEHEVQTRKGGVSDQSGREAAAKSPDAFLGINLTESLGEITNDLILLKV